MKKIWFLTTLLIGSLLLTGCNKLNSEIDEIRALELAKTKEWRIELCNNKILAEVDSWATNFVWEEVIYSEWDEDSRHSDNFIYFSWSNWENKVYGCGLVRYWKFINLYPVDQDFLNSEEYQQLGELRKMLTVKDEEPVIEEQKQNTLTEKDYQAKPLDDWWDWSETNDDFWYTTYAKVVQSWNFSNYKNDEYGFELNLPGSWNDWMLVHFKSVSNTDEIISDSFHLVYPRKGLEWLKVNPVFPTGWDTLILITVVSPDTTQEELNAQLLSDDNAIENNKYKFLFSIQDAPVNVFDWKVSKSDLECWKNPNCHCQHKEEYMIWEIWDKMPDPYTDLWCYLVTTLKDHMKLFNI